jgi:hypothetical protein
VTPLCDSANSVKGIDAGVCQTFETTDEAQVIAIEVDPAWGSACKSRSDGRWVCRMS